jgi:hypothetical protein
MKPRPNSVSTKSTPKLYKTMLCLLSKFKNQFDTVPEITPAMQNEIRAILRIFDSGSESNSQLQKILGTLDTTK